MITDLYYCEATGLLPYRNQALEEYLLRRVQPGELILYLWQNQRTVVIGRNQNSWQECRVELLQQDQGYLARRLSGGGAVFHDLGNLNFTFITTDADYHLPQQLAVIINALAAIGIKAVKSGRNDLLIADRKFSGNAFYKSGANRYHHGTIMVDVDMTDLGRYLQPSADKLAAKGVNSVRSRVANLAEFVPEITVDQLKKLLIHGLGDTYGLPVQEFLLPADAEQELALLTERYAHWQWVYGRQADFDVQLTHRFAWGGISFNLQIERGMIANAVIYSDAMDGEFIASLAPFLSGCRYDTTAMVDSLQRAVINNRQQAVIIDELSTWLQKRG